MVSKKTRKILKILGVMIAAVYFFSGLFILRHYRTEQEPKLGFRGWIYYWDGPYKGKVVDLDTGTPIESAVVAGSWYLEVMAGWPEFCDARETLTDKNGEFVLPRAWCISFWPIANFSFPGNVVVFKPGYLGYPPLGYNQEQRKTYMPDFTGDEFADSRQYNLIKLGKPKTRSERELTNDDAHSPLDFNQTYRKLPILLKLINEDRKTLGFEGDIGSPEKGSYK